MYWTVLGCAVRTVWWVWVKIQCISQSNWCSFAQKFRMWTIILFFAVPLYFLLSKRFHWLDISFIALKKVSPTIGCLPRSTTAISWHNWLLLLRRVHVYMNWMWTNHEFQCNQCKFDLNVSWKLSSHMSLTPRRSFVKFFCSLLFGIQISFFWQCVCSFNSLKLCRLLFVHRILFYRLFICLFVCLCVCDWAWVRARTSLFIIAIYYI